MKIKIPGATGKIGKCPIQKLPCVCQFGRDGIATAS